MQVHIDQIIIIQVIYLGILLHLGILQVIEIYGDDLEILQRLDEFEQI
jgi:hypothetical protein